MIVVVLQQQTKVLKGTITTKLKLQWSYGNKQQFIYLYCGMYFTKKKTKFLGFLKFVDNNKHRIGNGRAKTRHWGGNLK
jgi:hypothetical protein